MGARSYVDLVLSKRPVAYLPMGEQAGTAIRNLAKVAGAVNGALGVGTLGAGLAPIASGRSPGVRTTAAGATDGVSVADYARLDAVDRMSVVLWAYLVGTNGPVLIAKRDNPNYAWEMAVGNDASGNPLLARVNANANVAQSPGPVPANRWVMLGMSYDRSKIRAYIDGAPVADFAFADAITTSNVPLTIARRNYAGVEAPTNGILAHVAFFADTEGRGLLTPADFAELHRAGRRGWATERIRVR